MCQCRNELHSDVTLVAGGVKINAHRVVLSAQSPTFKTMFNAGMRESQEREVVLAEISGEVLEVLVSYFYGAQQHLHVCRTGLCQGLCLDTTLDTTLANVYSYA